jgi:hypothetical protein
MAAKVELPKPDERGTRRLPDGSRIFTSGGDYMRDGVEVKMPNVGKFMLWLKSGTECVDGTMRDVGEFIITNTGPMYFDTALKAMNHSLARA